jgi:ABC-type transport system involved in Fe-S cluster assembly fused permease/ATPase subunit
VAQQVVGIDGITVGVIDTLTAQRVGMVGIVCSASWSARVAIARALLAEPIYDRLEEFFGGT